MDPASAKLIEDLLAEDREDNGFYKYVLPSRPFEENLPYHSNFMEPRPDPLPNSNDNSRWFYYDAGNLIPYDDITNAKLNKAFNAHENMCRINPNAIVDFTKELQINDKGMNYTVTRIEGVDMKSIAPSKHNEEKKANTKNEVMKLLEQIERKNNSGISNELPKLPPEPPAYKPCRKTLVKESSSEFIAIKREFDRNMRGHYTYLEIFKLDNPRIKYFFNENLIQIVTQNKSTVDKTVKNLFFSPKCDLDPSKIYNGYNEGFDPRLTDNGLWGNGVHFTCAAIPDGNYIYQNSEGIFEILYAKVIIGECYNYGTMQKPYLKYPPSKPKSRATYDSVKGRYRGYDYYVTYEKNMAYPEYLIMYAKY